MASKRDAAERRGADRRRRSVEPPRRPADAVGSRRSRSRSAKGSASAGPQTAPMPRLAARPAPAKNTRQAKARAKARKAKAPKVVRPPLRDRLILRLTSIELRPQVWLARVPFVVVIIASLGIGLGITLWLSTDSAERSYQLGNAREENRVLLQQKEALEREVLEEQAAPALAEAARELGMIPTKDAAHLVQDPSGNWVVVGTPKPAEGVPPPPLNAKLPDPQPAAPPPPPPSVEVPIRLSPQVPDLAPVGTPGGEILLRAPDGAMTLGAEHLPDGTAPVAPGPAVPPPAAVPPVVAAPPAATPGAPQ